MIRIAILENNVTSTLSMRKKLTSRLREYGYEVTTFTTGTPENIKLAREQGFSITDIGSSVQNPIDILRYLWNLKKALANYQTDICLTFTIRPAIWGNVVTRFLGIPTITNITGIGPLFDRNNLAYRGARILYKFVLSKTARIIFQNEDDREIFIQKKFAHPSRTIKVPGSGIDYKEFTPQAKTRTDDAFQFLFVSRLVKDKGILEFIESAKRLHQEFPTMRFKIIGPFWTQNLKDNTITPDDVKEWTSHEYIEYLGEQNNVKPFMANADCIVLPSYREGTSNVLLEACCMERPCVTCNVTGCKEIVQDNYNGFLCEPKNADSLYHAMKKMMLLTPERRNEMGKLGRQKMIREFDKQIVIDAYHTAIDEVMAEYRRKK